MVFHQFCLNSFKVLWCVTSNQSEKRKPTSSNHVQLHSITWLHLIPFCRRVYVNKHIYIFLMELTSNKIIQSLLLVYCSLYLWYKILLKIRLYVMYLSYIQGWYCLEHCQLKNLSDFQIYVSTCPAEKNQITEDRL